MTSDSLSGRLMWTYEMKTRNEIHKGKMQVSSSHEAAWGLPATVSGPSHVSWTIPA